jgi:hypothetical protein
VDQEAIAMPDVYVSRYVNMTPAQVLDALQLHRPMGAGPSARLGTPTRLHDSMALVPVAWSCGDAVVIDGNLRLIPVGGGDLPVTEVLLVGYRNTAGVDAPALLEDLLTGACPPHGRPVRPVQAV